MSYIIEHGAQRNVILYTAWDIEECYNKYTLKERALLYNKEHGIQGNVF